MKRRHLLCLLACALPLPTFAHPVPDVPVRSFFEADGSSRIEVEIDTRCFTADPENEPYLVNRVFKQFTEAEKSALVTKAQAFIPKTVALFIEPSGKVDPTFEYTFTSHRGEPLVGDEDPVMVTAIWKSKPDPRPKAYRIEALPEGKLSVLFLNHVNDQAVPRFQVLFPGEKSYRLDIPGSAQ